MAEDTILKILYIPVLIIGYLLKALMDSRKDDKKDKIYICPLDKSGIDNNMKEISKNIDKLEDKSNSIISTTFYNKKIIEHIDEHYDKISEAFIKLTEYAKRNIEQNEKQINLLEKISKNGH